MSWQNQSGNGGNKNPWGRGPGDQGGPRNPWGGGGNGGGSGNGGTGGGRREPPKDFDDMLRRAQDHLRQVMPDMLGGGRMIALGVLAILALWLASGLYIVEPGMQGVIQRFGKWERTQTDEGLGYRLPWPVETIQKVNVSEVRRMSIGFTDANSNAKIAARDIPEESLMLTADANIVDLDLVVLWNIKSAEEYLFNIRDPENTIKKVAESAIREVVGQTAMLPIITQERAQVAEEARKIMVKNLDSYKSGINIAQVLIQEAEVHPEVQDAFQDVQSAKQDAIDVQNRAQAYRQDILPKARGEAIQLIQKAEAYRDSKVAQASGEAQRFNAVLEAYRSGEDVTRTRIYLETMEDVLNNSQKIIMDAKGANGVVPYLPLNELSPASAKAQPAPERTVNLRNPVMEAN